MNECRFYRESLIYWRVFRGLSRPQLAEQAGLSLGAVIRAEDGSRSPTVDTLAKLSRALTITTAELLSPPPSPVVRLPRHGWKIDR